MNAPASMSSHEDIPAIESTPWDDGGYFERHLGVSLERLLTPLDGSHPTGLPVRGTMMYRMVEQARRSDDATLPMGSWAVELKHANWPKTSSLIANVLSGSAKDLQLAAWLLEAEIHQRGFAALAPCITLLRGLCDRWWETLHPQGEHGDFDARINIVRWLNEKLIPALSLIPLVDDGERVASWSQWELAHHYERLQAVHGKLPEEAQEAANLDQLRNFLSGIPIDHLRVSYATLADGRTSVAEFEASLRHHLDVEAPSLSKLDDFLARAQSPLRSEIARRGESLETPSDVKEAETTPESGVAASEAFGDADPVGDMGGIFSDRERAYQALAEIAEFLMQVEPHSPVPYLLRRAVRWGELNTAELYQEIFMRSNAQINVFELLGIQAGSDEVGP